MYYQQHSTDSFVVVQAEDIVTKCQAILDGYEPVFQHQLAILKVKAKEAQERHVEKEAERAKKVQDSLDARAYETQYRQDYKLALKKAWVDVPVKQKILWWTIDQTTYAFNKEIFVENLKGKCAAFWDRSDFLVLAVEAAEKHSEAFDLTKNLKVHYLFSTDRISSGPFDSSFPHHLFWEEHFHKQHLKFDLNKYLVLKGEVHLNIHEHERLEKLYQKYVVNEKPLQDDVGRFMIRF